MLVTIQVVKLYAGYVVSSPLRQSNSNILGMLVIFLLSSCGQFRPFLHLKWSIHWCAQDKYCKYCTKWFRTNLNCMAPTNLLHTSIKLDN